MTGSVATDTWWPIESVSASAVNDDDRVNVSVWPLEPQLFIHIGWWWRKKNSDMFFALEGQYGLQRSYPKNSCCDDFLSWVFFFLCLFSSFWLLSHYTGTWSLCQSPFSMQHTTNNCLLFKYLRFISLCLVMYFFIKADVSWTCLLAVSGRYIFFLSFWRQIFL